MSKIKLTKSELKKQRDSLRQFEHYLPTLQLKKQQLQIKILEARQSWEQKQAAVQEKEKFISRWAGLLADPALSYQGAGIDFKKWITPTEIITDKMNIAGANIPVFKEIKFLEAEYDLYATPFWVDYAIETLRAITALISEMAVIERQIAILQRELRITTQRVNLFEKIKIPECRENIRKIRIYLGDQQANAVGISKVAKKKIVVAAMEPVAV